MPMPTGAPSFLLNYGLIVLGVVSLMSQMVCGRQHSRAVATKLSVLWVLFCLATWPLQQINHNMGGDASANAVVPLWCAFGLALVWALSVLTLSFRS